MTSYSVIGQPIMYPTQPTFTGTEGIRRFFKILYLEEPSNLLFGWEMPGPTPLRRVHNRYSRRYTTPQYRAPENCQGVVK